MALHLDIAVRPLCIQLTRLFYSPAMRSDTDLRTQIAQAERTLQECVTYPLLWHQWQALLCLVADIHAGLAETPEKTSFETSFLCKALNEGMLMVAAGEFHAFCYQHGVLDPRTYQKRRAEVILFLEGKLPF